MSEAKKRIFILGAGFSYHKAKILLKDYVAEIKKLSNKNSKQIDRNPEEPAKRVMKFLNKEQISQMCDIELLFSNIEHVINRRGITFPFISDLIELENIRNDMRIVLRTIFFDTQRNGQYTDEIIKFCSKLKKGDSVITFNYDCFLENSIYWAKFINNRSDIPLFNPLKGYLFHFDSDNIRDKIFNNNNIELFNRTNESDIKILKLHGSVNWSRNNFERNICLYEMTPGNPIADRVKDMVGQARHNSADKTHLWMIEPSYDKNISEFIALWKEASHEMSGADEIIIIGYSFPDADFHFQHIFQKSIKNNKKSCKFKIVDPNAKMIEEKIKKLLVVDNINLRICENKFENWVKNLKELWIR